jgi:hypothetical protein
MLDLSHIPNSQQDVQIFYAVSGSNSWQTWQKPRKCNYVWIMCIGGGGGGGGGSTGGAYSTGGAAGGVSRALYNAQQLPDTLYVQVGLGGAGGGGGIPGSLGADGTRSFVSLLPTITAQNTILGSGTAAAVGGKSGLGTSAAGETAITQTTATFLTLSNFIGTAGNTATGTLTEQPPDITPFNSQITCPGGGGPSWPFSSAPINGASILSSSISPRILGGIGAIASGSNGGNGADGITSWKPFFSTGGAGGGSSISGSGGKGGNGGIGSGGGAGAGGNNTIGYVMGAGGKGGDGLVVIISF